MKYTHLIWDFNGTVLDDVAIGIESANALLARCGVKAIPSVEYYRSVFGFPIRDYYARLGIDFEKTSFEELAPIWVEEYLSRAERATLNEGVMETMEAARRLGVSQILLSATEIDMLKGQLSALGMETCFDGVFGMDNIHAVSKAKRAEMWCRDNPNARPLFFGDTDHDFAVATATGNDCVLFSGGHQSKEQLSKLGCPIVDKIADVIYYLV
ncbi:MAG: HAD family hydrolase [Clostridia bacterium]|nr:HAD family hydrolase [Clostridia bacterium]